MDIEMPVLDGISAVRGSWPVSDPILMFSSSPTRGQGDPGCAGCRCPRFSAQEIRRHRPGQGRGGQPAAATGQGDRPQAFPDDDPAPGARAPGAARPRRCPLTRPPSASQSPCVHRAPRQLQAQRQELPAGGHPGTSTGGPVALQNVLTKLPGDFPHPILLIQHMPATFTAAFAARLNGQCQIGVRRRRTATC